MKIPFSDTYGFSKYRFYNPVIKEFSTNLVNNLANIYRSRIGHQRPNHARDLRTAVIRAPIGKACIFMEENVFIPFERITKDSVQFNIGNPIDKSEIPGGMVAIGDILDRQNLESEEWMFGLKEKTLLSIRIKNRMFKEKSLDLNIDFILNFGQYIKKKAWSRKDFEKALKDVDLSVYYILLLDENDTVGIPIAFTYSNGHFYAYINNETKYIKIVNLQKLLMDEEKINTLKKINVMDLKHRC